MNVVKGTAMGKKTFIFSMVVFLAGILAGCTVEDGKTEKMNPVEFTIVKKDELPEEVKKEIAEREQEEFQMTCQWGEELYLMKGYGIQNTGGYSIQVEYVKENAKELHVKTRLIGPSSKEEQKKGISFPYIVIKAEKKDKMVIFD